MSKARKHLWTASDYLDLGIWGILDGENNIILGSRVGLSKDQCKAIVEAHNLSLSADTNQIATSHITT